jgi:ABC-type glycerol-3-phosphate transport system substrate-binding protein
MRRIAVVLLALSFVAAACASEDQALPATTTVTTT